MRASAFFTKGVSAFATSIGGGLHELVGAPEEEEDEACQEHVAHVVARAIDEDEVAEHQGRGQSEDIEHGCIDIQQAEGLTQRSDQYHPEQPETNQQHGEDKRNLKRREGGVVVEMLPRLWIEMADALVERGAERHEQAEEEWVGTPDVVEVDQLQLLSAKCLNDDGYDEQGQGDEEVAQVRVSKHMDGIGYVVHWEKVGTDVLQIHPALYLLGVGQLHQDAVSEHQGVDGKLSHHHQITLVHHVLAVLQGQASQVDGVCDYLEVGIQREVIVVQVAQGVLRRLAHFHREGGLGIFAGNEDEQEGDEQ